jgi:hypothetical protein
MSKTNFSNGDTLTAAYMNTIYNTGGGHLHDGVDADGHAQKIDLSLHTTSTMLPTSRLPQINLEPGYTGPSMVTGMLTLGQITGLDYVDRSSSQGVTGLKTFNSGITVAGTAGITLSRTSPTFSFEWQPVAIVTGSLPVNSYVHGYRLGAGSDISGGAEYLYVGEMYSSTAQSGGIPNTAFVWPVSSASMTWDITAYDSSVNTWAMHFTHVASASGWGGVVNYQAVVQPSTVPYQTGLSTNYLAIGSDTSNLWFWYKTSTPSARYVRFVIHMRVIGQQL